MERVDKAWTSAAHLPTPCPHSPPSRPHPHRFLQQRFMTKATAPTPTGSQIPSSSQEIRLRNNQVKSHGGPTRESAKQHPVAYGYRQVWVRGYVDRVVIGCAAEVIARHPRSYEGEDMVFDPLHYLPLIERKTGALDQAAPLAGWELPDAFATLRRLMEARSGRAGRREYVQVLRLFETFGTHDVHAAVRHALRLGAIGFDAVKHLVLCRVEKRPPKLDLDVYPYLPKANVGKTCAASYLCLMSGCVR